MDNEFYNLLDQYVNFVKREQVNIIFQKSCGYKIFRTFHKFSTISDMIRDVNAFWGNTRKIVVYHENNVLENDDNRILKDFCRNNMKPVYENVDIPVCYMFYIDDSNHCPCHSCE